MKKFAIIFLISFVLIVKASDAEDTSYLHGKRLSDASFVEMHNMSRYNEPGWQYPSPTGNQNLTVPQALEYAKERGAILSMKTPAHWTKELGQRKGEGPIMAAHGMYRRTFDDDYYSEFGKLMQEGEVDIEKVFAELGEIPVVQEAIAPLLKKYRMYKAIVDGYRYWSKPVAQMERVARESTYGSDDTAARIPFEPCVIDPSARPLVQVLTEIKTFLDKNRQQLVMLKIENVTDSTDAITQQLQEAGIASYAYKQDENALWPTIEELVENNKRFIPFITTDVSEDNPSLNAESDFIWSANWDYQTKDELVADHHVPTDNANYERWESGKPVANAMYRLPCHLTQGFAGRPDLAEQVNTREVITERMRNIGKGKPTFLPLDFIDIGEGFDVVREWNEG